MKKYEIKRLGRLSLAYKTFIGREATNDEIEITMWNKKNTSRWTIASFEKDKEGYYLESCGERLNNEEINWFEFGILVRYGFDYLNDKIQLIEEDKKIEFEDIEGFNISYKLDFVDYKNIEVLKNYLNKDFQTIYDTLDLLIKNQKKLIDEVNKLKGEKNEK